MKWKKRGHEFDIVYNEIESKNAFYLFGAGDYGHQFLKIFKNEIELKGYIDNNREKQKRIIEGYYCYDLDEIELLDSEAIIITMSQIARVQPIRQLEKKGYVKNSDFFIIEEFLSIYYVYKYNKIYFSSISFLPSTACNLKCRHCLNFNPFAKEYYIREWSDLKTDIDLFFSCVDYIMLFHVSGGEPLLYKYTPKLIKYLDEHYGDKINTLRLVTNGTIVPEDTVLEQLSQCNVEITVDDYRKAVPQYREQFHDLIKKLDAYKIKYYINEADFWIDLAPEKTDYSNLTDLELIQHRSQCNQSWQELRDRKLYNCNYAAYATVAGIAGTQDMEEVFELENFSEENKKELIEFRLGYTNKGYTNFCKKCRGFTPDNDEKVKPALQVQPGENHDNYL